MSKAAHHMMQQLEKTIEYVRKEFDASYAEIIGCLHIKAHELTEECLDNDPEDWKG